MPLIFVSGSTNNNSSWEENFRTQSEVFGRQAVTRIQYAMNDGDRIGVLFETDDLDTFFEVFKSEATARAMADDGFQADSAEVFVLDHDWVL